ncbi:hypothetical protein I8751_21745 [Nostocaceae cyanobacterium CENA357]|uniref:Uncharacterized protein n=1 Tax=Atlanticothrix silvestris CENA357 TaxID=1725252 RepID=A0A8J7HHR2_9CYAN|nr:hypothetical protein [Atlanticothrix silvestris]MBH8554923.1 hypothetical protein [Atlanticothrix silvestris CENA357]
MFAGVCFSFDGQTMFVICDEGTEFIKFTNGKEITVDTAWRWGWERVLGYVTNQ